MGFLSTLFGGSSAKEELAVREFPGGFDDPKATKAAKFATQLSELTSQRSVRPSAQLPGATESPFFEPLLKRTLFPEFRPNTPAQRSLVKSIAELTGGQTALTGTTRLQPVSQEAIAQAIAPTIVGFEQQELENLQRAELGTRGQQLTERGQDIQGGLGSEQLDIQNFSSVLQALLELVDFASPERIAATIGEKSSTAGIIPGLSSLLGAGAAGKEAGVFGNKARLFGTS